MKTVDRNEKKMSQVSNVIILLIIPNLESGVTVSSSMNPFYLAFRVVLIVTGKWNVVK